MSEDRPEYVTDALEMVGKGYKHEPPAVEIVPAHTSMELRGDSFKEVEIPNFVKISTAFKQRLKEVDEIALKVWLFIALSVNRYSGKANPGLRTIHEGTGLAINTIRAAIERLEHKYHLMTVDRASRKYNIYEPTAFVSARKETVSADDTPQETVSDDPESVSFESPSVSAKPESVSPRVILNHINQNNQKKPEINNNACAVFYDLFSIDLKGRERTRFNELVVKHGWTRVHQVLEWAAGKEIHMENRAGLINAISKACDTWTDAPAKKVPQSQRPLTSAEIHAKLAAFGVEP